MLPLPVIEQGIEPIVIKNSDQLVSFKIGDVQMLEILNFLRAATRVDSFLRACKTSGKNSRFPLEWFNDLEKLNITLLPPYETFFSNHIALDKNILDFQSSKDGGLTSEKTFLKMKLKQPSAIAQKTIKT